MNIARQFSIFLENRPGRLAEVAGTLARGRVNIVAMDVLQAAEQSVLRLVVDDPSRARSILKRDGLGFAENEVLILDLPNVPGALADLSQKLARARVNIEYAYGSTGGNGGNHARIVAQVSDHLLARKVLEPVSRPPVHPLHEKPRYVNREGRTGRY
jgi:hypothetical protein